MGWSILTFKFEFNLKIQIYPRFKLGPGQDSYCSFFFFFFFWGGGGGCLHPLHVLLYLDRCAVRTVSRSQPCPHIDLGNRGCFSVFCHSHFIFAPLCFNMVIAIICTSWIVSAVSLTRWGLDKWTPFGRRHFQVHFLEWKCLNSY